MRNHHIICGAGRVGNRIADMFDEHKLDFVIIEKDKKVCEFLKQKKFDVIRGSALDEKCLKEAGIETASWILACLGNDADNLYIVFKARDLTSDIKIAARVSEEESLEAFYKTDVELIVMPEVVGGIHLAKAIMGREQPEDLQTIFKKVTGGGK